jgi:CPA2 family monovalent cation:H+ antiporter-2
VPETIEASLQLAEAVLVDLGIPMGPVLVSIHEKRAEFQAEIKSAGPGAPVRALGQTRLRRNSDLAAGLTAHPKTETRHAASENQV